MKLKSKIKIILLVMILGIVGFSFKSYATSISLSASKSSVSPGEQFTVSVTGNDATGKVNISVSGGSASSSSVWVENNTQSITVTAGSSGTVSISAIGDVSDSTGTDHDGTGSNSVSVSIAQPATPAPDNSGSSGQTPNTPSTPSAPSTQPKEDPNPILTNLGIRPNDFKGFKSAKTSYSTTVPNDCTSVTIYAKGNGNISGTGAVNLKEGTNRFTITVSNSKGSKSYNLSIIRQVADEATPNLVDDSETETTTDETQEQQIIGLSSLAIEGYNFNEEFKIDNYNYTITVDTLPTQGELDQIKEKLTYQINTENVTADVVASISEDGVPTITISVKDDEKEYSKYTITFVKGIEETTEVNSVKGTTVSPKSGNVDYYSQIKNKMYIVLGISLITSLFALYYSIAAYRATRKLKRYISDEIPESENEDDSSNYIERISNEKNPEPKMTPYKFLDEDDEDDIKSKVDKFESYDVKKPRSKGKH